MKIENLKEFEASFEFITELPLEETILGITDLSELKHHHLFFIKNGKFLDQYFASTIESRVAVVLEEKFSSLISSEDLANIKKKAWFIAKVKDVNLAMSFLSKPFYDEKFQAHNDIVDARQMGTATIHPSAWIAQGAFIGDGTTIDADVKIHPGVVLMSGVQVGAGTEIYPNTTIYRNVKIGKGVRIHAQCAIGADGFGYNYSQGVHHKVWHMGGVVIGDEVEIGANTCIDSGTFSPTYIGNGTKIDNLCQIGHNVKLGTGVIMCGKAGIAGSTTLGDFTVMGGNSDVSNGLVIGKGVQIAGGAGVTGNHGDGEVIAGFPARNIKEWLKGVAYLRKLSLTAPKDKK